jgi:cellulose synthase/poly-beta-1,6-N-acetylglucosamine synthase-like glycosyltransferase
MLKMCAVRSVHRASARAARRGSGGNIATTLVLGAAALGAYTYLVFPAILRRAAARLPAAGEADEDPVGLPTMTVVVPAHDEAAVIERKVKGLIAQDYPEQLLDVLVVDDGSTDGTPGLARHAGARVLTGHARAGKQAAVNRGVEAATGTVVCITDANSELAPGALRALAGPFADGRVAVVSGAKQVVGDGAVGGGEGLYWRLESRVKEGESRFGCVMGADGGVMAVRRNAFEPIPSGVVNDDFHLALDAMRRGHLVRYAPDAVATESVSASLGEEFERRTRIAAGTWQGVLGHLELASPRVGWRALSFVSHRFLRSIVLPVLLAAAWIGTGFAARRSARARVLFVAQTSVYAGAAVGAVSNSRVLAAPFQLAFTNLATLRGALRYLRGRQPVAWERVQREDTP